MINPDIYRKSNGIISFKYITDDVKYDNKFLIKILDVLLVDNLIKNWKNDITNIYFQFLDEQSKNTITITIPKNSLTRKNQLNLILVELT